MTTKLLASITVFVLLTGVVSTSMMQSVYAVDYGMNDNAKAAEKKAAEKKAADAKMASGKTTSSNVVTVEMIKGSSNAKPGCADKCYTPNAVKIKVGGTVTWKNVDTAIHTVTSQKVPTPDVAFDSSIVNGGASFNHKFDKAGTYDYFCVVHPWMTGKVTVS